MTSTEFIQRLPAMREFLPQPIIQEWTIEEYRAGMRALERRLLAALDRWRGEDDKSEIDSNFSIFDS